MGFNVELRTHNTAHMDTLMKPLILLLLLVGRFFGTAYRPHRHQCTRLR